MNQTKLDVYETAILKSETVETEEFGILNGLQILRSLENTEDDRTYNYMRNLAGTNACIDRVFRKFDI